MSFVNIHQTTEKMMPDVSLIATGVFVNVEDMNDKDGFDDNGDQPSLEG